MKHRRSVAFAVGGVLVLAATTILVLVVRPPLAARSLTNDVIHMKGRQITPEALRQWANSYDGNVDCDSGGCTVEVSNTLLHRIRLAPPTRFMAGVATSEGRVVATSLVVVSLENAADGATTRLTIYYSLPLGHQCSGRTPFVRRGPIGKAPHLTYIVTPETESTAIEVAKRINYWCLFRLGGCTTDIQQAPEAWAYDDSNSTGCSGL